MSQIVVHSDTASVILPGRVVVGVLPNGPIHVLEDSAAVVWECAGSPAIVDSLIDEVLTYYAEPPAGAREDVEQVVNRLLGLGLLQRIDDDAPLHPADSG